MKRYFYTNGQEKEGPFSLEELKMKDIYPNTLIWHEGLEDWKEAENIDELREIFELSPPPLNSEIETLMSSEKLNTDNTHSMKNLGDFLNYFSFYGRIGRTEYAISLIIIFVICIAIEAFITSGDLPLVALAYIPVLWFLFAQGAKRCNDIGTSGWYQILPFYIFWMIFQKGLTRPN